MIASIVLFLTGAALALFIALRNPGYGERYNWWPTWPEWAVQAFGVTLISVALLREMLCVLVNA